MFIGLSFIALTTLFAPSGAPAASPAPTATPAMDLQCPARVFDVVPLKADLTGASAEYLVAFEVSGANSGRMSGSVALFSGNTRYDATFEDAVASGSFVARSADATPALIRFPAPVVLDAAYLTAIGGNAGGDCPMAFVWLKSAQATHGRLHDVMNSIESRLRAWAPSLAAVDASPAKPLGAAPCSSPTQVSRVTHAAVTETGDSRAAGTFITETSLTETGTVVDAWLWAWLGARDGSSGLDDAALHIAKTSDYSPEVFRCQKVASVVLMESIFPPAH